MRDDRARGWSRQTEIVLLRAGWHPGRSVPTGTWESVLRERGPFVVHDAARRFLSEFGGLVTYGWPADTITTSTAVRFDPLTASWQRDRFASASREAGVPLYPVGTADEGASLLGISEGGVLHLVRDHVERLGTVGEQALDRLLFTQRTRSALWTPVASDDDHPFWRRFESASPGTEAGLRCLGQTDRVLRAAGWYPGRSLPTDTWESLLTQTAAFRMHDAARRFLAEFGALAVPYRRPWESTPCIEFSLDPLSAFWDAEIIEDLAEQAGVALFPIGTRDRGNQYLAMAEDGAVYAGMDSVWLLAPTPDEAMQRLTTRIRPTSSI